MIFTINVLLTLFLSLVGPIPMRKLSYNDKLSMQTLWQVSHCLVYSERLSQCGRLDCIRS